MNKNQRDQLERMIRDCMPFEESVFNVRQTVEGIVEWVDEALQSAREQAIADFLKVPYELHTSLDGIDSVKVDGRDYDIPEEFHEKPLCRIGWAEDRGDPSVGIPASCSFVLAPDQTGMLLPDLIDAWYRTK